MKRQEFLFGVFYHLKKRSLLRGFVVTAGKIGKKDGIELVDFFRIVK